MLYREAGQYKTSYAADMAVFPAAQDRIGIGVILFVAFVGHPAAGNDFMLQAVLIPFLVFSLAAIGLNILTGYTGLFSLGTGAFMGVGAYACYKLTTIFPDVNIIVWVLASGFFSAAVGVLFGLPSLRIKGFYLAVATLAAQFFLSWCFIRMPWLYNYNVSGAIEVPTRTLFGVPVTGATATPTTRYLVVLTIVVADDLARLEPGARPHRPHVDGGARHGHRRRADRHPAAADQAARLRGLVVLLRRRRRDDGVLLVRRRRSRRVRRQPELPHPVHGDHRRARQPDRLVLRRRADLHPADRDPCGARRRSACRCNPQPSSTCSS